MSRELQQIHLFDQILAIRKAYVDYMNKSLNQYGLSSAQWLVLKIIVHKQSTTLVEIARIRNIEKPTATKIIQSLINNEFIKSSVGQDKRLRLLTPTDKGYTVYEEVMIMITSVQTTYLKDIDVETLQTINDALSTIKITED
ncbi:MarR family winged helix-turn-helix transcriptional regulator [Macrococcoides bohemicum]|uniref:MarR family winged helix-turn-helix transcriptional regulator n=1 Tax=Macrococcoides bohemicum TaxID=1903056 RepID=UPI00193F86F1|nr:SMC-Scp complex subunit ScpB [Macrococcus bohemicus]QRN48854.1 SMC-Scp complex subunit ScpB [Macrococcus bohemicus]QYA44991.1 SMC-Scp complex subunit ScpB [Macrococcus bohemicus]